MEVKLKSYLVSIDTESGGALPLDIEDDQEVQASSTEEVHGKMVELLPESLRRRVVGRRVPVYLRGCRLFWWELRGKGGEEDVIATYVVYEGKENSREHEALVFEQVPSHQVHPDDADNDNSLALEDDDD